MSAPAGTSFPKKWVMPHNLSVQGTQTVYIPYKPATSQRPGLGRLGNKSTGSPRAKAGKTTEYRKAADNMIRGCAGTRLRENREATKPVLLKPNRNFGRFEVCPNQYENQQIQLNAHFPIQIIFRQTAQPDVQCESKWPFPG
jgi:hypothetical protein